MTKETLMQLAVTYAECFHFDVTSGTGNVTRTARARQKLEYAIEAALAQARMDSLEDAAKVCESWDTTFTDRIAAAVRALKERV